MSKYTKYKLYQKYETRGSQEAIPCYPNVFSIDGDGTMPLVIVEENSRDCGYTGETQPIYRWYTLPIDTYYYCDACQEAQYKWVNLPIAEDWECVGTTKYYKQKKQVSVDGGSTWTDVTPPQYQRGALYEYSSQSCGYRTRTTTGSPYCEGYDKYVNVYTETSSDGGSTWITASTSPTLVEHNSTYCGYVPPTGYSSQYLTFVVRNGGKFKFSYKSSSGTLYYSLDSGRTWNDVQDNVATPTVQSGQKIMWKGNLTPSSLGIGSFRHGDKLDNYFDVEGNIMSLLYGDNFVGQTNLSGKDHAFNSLFTDSNLSLLLVNAENLVLPATTLSIGCYESMFWDCYDLITPPQLPAMIMVEGCYYHMFANCTSMVSVPKLPSTTLATRCYYQMFLNCKSLTNVSDLKLLATTLANQCYDSMFWGCSSLTTAPELPASTLVYRCYAQMFWNCCQLNYVKCLATNGINSNSSTLSWIASDSNICSISSSGTFVKASSASWPRGANGIPNNWTVQNA